MIPKSHFVIEGGPFPDSDRRGKPASESNDSIVESL